MYRSDEEEDGRAAGLPSSSVEDAGRDDWISQAASLPIAFAQVREDPLIDREIVRRIPHPPQILMIGSGGETVALLASERVARIDVVDANPAQLDLCRLKLRLLQHDAPDQRKRLLGYASMPATERRHALELHLASWNATLDQLGPPTRLATEGPDHCGRYEVLFQQLRRQLTDVQAPLEALLQLRDPDEQARRAGEGTRLGSRLAEAFAETMALDNLVRLFGSAATANRRQPFASHFFQQTQVTLATLPAADNPFLHQVLRGRFPPTVWPWLETPSPSSLPPIAWIPQPMAPSLRACRDAAYDFIHLSNILDWIAPAAAEQVLADAHRCLKPGGFVLIRQLNSRLPIRELSSQLVWQRDDAARLHAGDRSFFYRALHLATK